MSGETFFFYGTLCHLPLLETVLGRVPQARPARLAGHRVRWVADRDFPMIEAQPMRWPRACWSRG
jgi:ADP-ribose pyrophosphatase